jgi:hypothetical protein
MIEPAVDPTIVRMPQLQKEVPSFSKQARKAAGGKLILLKDSACRSDNK